MNLKTELVLWRLDRRLRRDVSFGRRRAIRRELRANLRDTTRDVGEREALRRLGGLDELTVEYRVAAGEAAPVRLDSGVRAVTVTTAMLLLLSLIRIPTFGTIEFFDPHTGSQQWQWGIRYFAEFHGDARTDTLFAGTVFSPAFLVLGTAAFAIAARAWRYRRTFSNSAGSA